MKNVQDTIQVVIVFRKNSELTDWLKKQLEDNQWILCPRKKTRLPMVVRNCTNDNQGCKRQTMVNTQKAGSVFPCHVSGKLCLLHIPKDWVLMVLKDYLMNWLMHQTKTKGAFMRNTKSKSTSDFLQTNLCITHNSYISRPCILVICLTPTIPNLQMQLWISFKSPSKI